MQYYIDPNTKSMSILVLIGILNIKNMFGVESVKDTMNIDLVINLQEYDKEDAYDRLGLESETETILGVRLPRVTIPVTPGRNLAVILELAAMNNRQKKMGFNAVEMLAAEHDILVNSGTQF